MQNIITQMAATYREGGVGFLLKQTLASLRIYERCAFYLERIDVADRSEAAFLPRITDFKVRKLTAPSQLDELIAEKIDIVTDAAQIRNRLEKGAVGILILVGQELAAMDFVATSQTGKLAFNSYPYSVDFAHGEACGGGAWTNPRFRGKGLFCYLIYLLEEHLKGKGFKTMVGVVEIGNPSSLKAHQKFAPHFRLTGRAISLTILGFRSWREKPLTAADLALPGCRVAQTTARKILRPGIFLERFRS